ncbi:MAG: hypothetical protein HYX53_02330 [Chloroflexi bacterium]|nr:hypothetical protein [Chloroflexota bacterium]
MRSAIARDPAYQQIAEEAVAAHQELAGELKRINAAITDLAARTAEVGRLMNEVG